jgi:hypothetical protein
MKTTLEIPDPADELMFARAIAVAIPVISGLATGLSFTNL